MKYNFDKPLNRQGTNCFKWDFLKPIFGKEDLLPFWVADMDFESPVKIIEALEKRVNHGVFGYPFRPDSYYESIINWYKKRHQTIVKKKWIVNTPGVVPGICFAIQVLTNPDDLILTHSPVYDPFFHSIEDNKRKLIISKLIVNERHYEMDFLDMEAKFKMGVKMMLFCSPHNPVGRVWTEEELKKLTDLCLKYNVILVSDEIHSDLIFPQCKHIQLKTVNPKISDKLILFNAPSKTFNIAGLATSYAIIENEKIRNKLSGFISNNHLIMGNIFGIVALENSYNFGVEWLEQLKMYLKSNYDFICDFLNERIPQIVPMRQEGTYLLWLDFSKLKLSSDDMKNLLLNDAKLAITDGRQYGNEGEGYFRFNYGCPRDLIERALTKLEVILLEKHII